MLLSMRSTDGKTRIDINTSKPAMRGLVATILLAIDGGATGDVESTLKGNIEK